MINFSTKSSPSRHVLKLLSVILSFLLWFYVLNSEPQEMVMNVPLTLKSPRGLAVSSEIPDTVSVKFKGSRAFMRTMYNSLSPVTINLSKYPYEKKKKFPVFLTVNDVVSPFGVSVLEVTPSELSVNLQKMIIKKVPVKLNFADKLPDELKLVQSRLKPDKVHIQGPIEIMRKITKVETQQLHYSDLKDQDEIKISFKELDSRVSFRKSYDLSYKYQIKPKKANLSLNSVKIKFLTSSKDYKPMTKIAALDVLAPEGKKIRSSDVSVVADIPDKKGVHNIKLKANLPGDIYLLNIRPAFIKVQVR